MPRPLRLDLPGARHHVMNRTPPGALLFQSDLECGTFLDLVATLPERFGVEVHAYALMPDHFHLLLGCPRASLGRAMQHLQSRYSAWAHHRRGTSGPMFRGRYRNRVVEDERYWAHLLAYLHLNPVRGRLAPRPEEANWTSCQAYYGVVPRPSWLRTDDLLDAHLGPEQLAQYTQEVQIGREEGPDDFDEAQLFSRPSSKPIPAPPAPRGWPLAEPDAWATLTRVTGMKKAALLTSPTGGGGGNAARDVAFWWLPRALGLPQRKVAAKLHLDPAVLTRAAQRARRRAREDEEVARWMELLEARLPG